ncbi:MAG TPA: glycosyl hydrolase, partial [Burkholderiaceae bacterium]|nr:glycosyl hydrolase [Burkholderiaceae bacterium]
MNPVLPAAVACAIGLAQATADGAALEIHTTAAAGDQRLAASSAKFAPGAQPSEGDVSVFVDPGKTHQTLLGIGGAITDASAEVFAKLSQEEQEHLLRAYYDPVDGIGYTLARTTIHSSDFSSASYTYVAEGDATLASFSVVHDRAFRIPLLRRAIAAAGGHLLTFASPWSAPAFMKTNGSLLQGGRLKPEFANAWARYFTLFIRAYEQAGIPIWGITVQNEPMATQRWESMIYSAEEERDFLKNHLGPIM